MRFIPRTTAAWQERGFTLLLAALISSIVLSLGAAVFEIAQKELALSATGRDSQFAFYAADTAAECALYWDVRFAYFGVIVPSGVSPTCDSQSFNATVTSGDRASGTYSMSFSYAPNGYCAQVSVSKTRNEATNAIISVVHSDGFSTKVNTAQSIGQIIAACTTAIQNDPRALQRSVELRY